MSYQVPNITIQNGRISFTTEGDQNNITVPYSIVQKKFHHLCANMHDWDDDPRRIKELRYIGSRKDNYVLFDNGDKEELPIQCATLDEVYDQRYFIEFDHKEDVKEQKFHNMQKAVRAPKITEYMLFTTPLDKRGEVTKEYMLERGINVMPTVEECNKYLRIAKIRGLRRSDWTQLSDIQNDLTVEEKAAWVEYRVKLRGLDKSSNPLGEIEIPLAPDQTSHYNTDVVER